MSEAEPTATEAPTAEETRRPRSRLPSLKPPTRTRPRTGPVVETLPPETMPEPVQGGTLRYGLEADVDGLNPTDVGTVGPWSDDGQRRVRHAGGDHGRQRVVPYPGESVEPASDDFKTWTMKLRPDITFHDGTPLNADAIIANFEAQRNDPLVGLAVRPFFPETERDHRRSTTSRSQFNLLDANAYFPATLVGQLGMSASPTWLAAAAADPTLNQQPVGTGPFKFDSRSQDSVTRFVRNDEWWDGEVYLDAVEFYPVPDTATRVDLMLGGELEALQTTDPDAIITLQDEGIPNVYDDSAAEQFAMINIGGGAVRRHPRSPGVGLRHATADLPRPDRARRDPRRQPALHPRGPVRTTPTSSRSATTRTQAIALATEYCNERGAETNPVTGAADVHRRQDQHRAPVLRSGRDPDPARRDPRRGLERGLQRHLRRAARGRAHPADRARPVQRQPVAPVRGRGSVGRQRLAAVPHDRRHLAQLAAVLRRAARRAAAAGPGHHRPGRAGARSTSRSSR